MLHFWSGGARDHQHLLFVHGWSCTHQVMQPLVNMFVEDYACTSIDLLGHGQSPKSQSDYSITAQCDAIAQTLGSALDKSIVIGHSMGGQIALELAARGHIRAAVLLDPAPIVPHEKAKAWAEEMRKTLPKVNVQSMMGAFARGQFIGPVEDAAADALIDAMQATDPDVIRQAWDGITDYDGPAALAALERPTLVISARKPLNDMRAFDKASKWVETAQTAGSGHMQQLEVPDQLNVMIRRFMTVIE